MKNQASIQLLKVGTPINPNADTGHIMLCADADGNLRIFGENGVELPIGSAVDESRLVPTGGRNGYLLGYQEGADRGNNVNTKLLLQPVTSDGQIVDQAAGNAAPVDITNSGNVAIEANALVFSGENSLLIPANALGMTLGGDNEFTIDIEFQLDSVKSDYATLYGMDGSPSSGRGALYFTSSGTATFTDSLGPNTTGWTLGTKHRITIERWNDNGTWKTSVYRNGSFLASSTAGMNILSNYVFPIGSNNEGTGRNFVGKIWAFRISNKAEHRGVSFTPRELPFLPPAGQPVWAEGIDRSRLLKVPTSVDNGKLPVILADKIPAVYHDTTLAAIVIEGDKVIDKISGKELTKVGSPQIIDGGIHSPTNSDYYMLELEGVEGLPVAVSFDYQGDESPDNSDLVVVNGNCAYYNLNGVSFCRTQGGGNNIKIDNQPAGVSEAYRNYMIQVSSDNYESKMPPVTFIAGESKSPTYEGSFPAMSPLSSVKVCGRFGKIRNILIGSAFPYTGNFTPRGDGVEGFGIQEKQEPGWNYKTLDEAANGRLLPANPANGDIPCYDTTATIGGGNDETVKFLLQPATTDGELIDSAAGAVTPATITNHSLTVSESGEIEFSSSKYATVPASGILADVLRHDKPWVFDLLVYLDQTSSQSRFFGTESGGDFFCQWTGDYGFDFKYGDTWISTLTGNVGEWNLLTLEYYQKNGTWHVALYLKGVLCQDKEISTSFDPKTSELAIGRSTSGSHLCSGKIRAIRIREGALYNGQSFTPDEFPYQEPQTVGEWGKFNLSNLVKSVNGKTPDENGNVNIESSGGTLDLSNYSGALKLTVPTGTFSIGDSSGNFINTVGTTLVLQGNEKVQLTAYNADTRHTLAIGSDGLLYDDHAINTASGIVVLGSDGKLPALDGSKLTNLPAVAWGDIPEKPETFPASAHNHAITDVTGLEDALQNAGTVKSVNGATPDSSGAVTLPEATASAAGLMAAADKAKLDGISTSEAWYTVADAAAITLDRANGELQKVTLTQNCVLTAPVLDADHSTLLLQVTSSSAVTVTVGETNIVTDHTGTFQVGWYWDGEATRRYPAVEIS